MKSDATTNLPGPLDSFLDAAEIEAFNFVSAPARQIASINQFSNQGSAGYLTSTNAGPQLYGVLDPTEEYTESVQSVSASTAGTTVAVSNGGLTFNLTFDVGAPVSFMTGIEQAASILSAAISDRITVNLNIHYTGTGGGAYAGPSTGLYESYPVIRYDLITRASPGDATFNALPNTSSIAGQSLVAVWNAQLKALGLLSPTNAATDGSATFATDIDSSLLVGVALHELTHALGRVPYGSAPDIFDLFRFTSPGVQLFTGGSTAVASYFSVDGGNTDIADYGLHSDPSDFLNPGPTFLGGPYSNLTPGDPFNELYGSGTLQSLTAVDKRLIDALGFHLTSTNTIAVTATSAQAVQGGAAVGLLNSSPVITDGLSTTLSGATIKVTAAAGDVFPGDKLFVNGVQSGTVDGGRITVSWNDSTKILTLAGVASIADYEALLNGTSYQWTGTDNSTGAHTPHTVTWTVNDGMGSFGTTSVITIERPPVATVANVVLDPNATTVAASSLLTASDPDGDAIATYAFKDTGNGHFNLNGVAQPTGQEIDVTAAQLSSLAFQSLGGGDSVQARVSDGTLWSSWQTFTIMGPAPTVIEAFGSTKLDGIGSNFYLDAVGSGAGTGPSLKVAGLDFYTGELSGWTPIGAEQTDGGYLVAWKLSGSDQYAVWNAENAGNCVSSLIGVVSGSDVGFEAFENSFQQDLNGDGVIAVVIDASGGTRLDGVGSHFYLDAVGSGAGTGPSLKWSGLNFYAGELGGWTPIGVEKTSTGYEVAWKVAGADQYTVWSADNTGNSVSGLIGVVSGSDVAFEAFEISFQQDLNGDGVTGVPATVAIEAFGATRLDGVGSHFYLDAVGSGAGTGPSLKWSGLDFYAGELGGWTPIGVEKTSTGYEVAWKVAGADQYTVWSADNAGNSVSGLIGVVSGSDVGFQAFENSFQQDLNGDGVTGVPAVVIEAFGATRLDGVGSHFYLDAVGSGAGTGPSLKWSGLDFYAGELGGWTPIGVEKTSTGYEVAWKVAGADQYTIWSADNTGNSVSSLIGVVSGSDVGFEAFENSFQQDLNVDGTIGIVSAVHSSVPQPTSFLRGNPRDDKFVFDWGSGANVQANARYSEHELEQTSLVIIDKPHPDLGWALPPVAIAAHDIGVNPEEHNGATVPNFHWLDLHGSHFAIAV